MKIKIVDTYGHPIKEMDHNFDSIMLEAEEKGGDPFFNAIEWIGNSIRKNEGFQIDESCHSNINKYLRKYAAFGYVKEPLIITAKKEVRDIPIMLDIASTNFEEIITFPNDTFQQRYNRLVGLDDLKMRIQKEAAMIIAPERLEEWSRKFHHHPIQALQAFHDRYPFFIFEGDVGTGKTEFAMTFGNELAHFIKKDVILTRMSMKSRGNGVVGEMSKLITKSFQEAKTLASTTKKPVIMILDEADSLAQSREENQMHHEDRAGVNALIQGIDHIRNVEIPILVVFCTNRVQAIDPAIKRRAAFIYTFSRPNLEQRYELFRFYFSDIALTATQLDSLAHLTGENENQDYAFTYSDLITRVIPQAVLTAYPHQQLTYDVITETVKVIKPTPPFKEG
ncbi:TPA: AAA family ATPase [Bacillus thuringiensis]|nr:AAA family ATPase [Bacillus thuringiensis]